MSSITTLEQLIHANKELAFQNKEKEKRAAELAIANKELVFQNKEKGKRADEIILVNSNLKKAEEKLQNVNRLYAFISHINQIIVKVKDEQTLFKEACRIAINEGKFNMAWIGIADISSRKIRLVASSGTTKSDLEILANKTYDANGPTEKVLEGKDFYTIMDVQNEKEISWSDYGAERGFNSAISLPLKKSGKVIGTFDLYSSEINFFDKEEIKMLQEAAADISFGINIIEKANKQRETEKLIVENEKRFRTLIEKSTDVIMLTTFEGEVMYGSPSVTKIFGYTFAECFHKQFRDFIHPDDFKGFSENITDILQTPGKSFFCCQRLLHKDGSWIWCEGTVTNMLAEPGIYAIVSNFQDITERKQTEEKLLQSEKRFRLLIEKSADMKTLSNREGKIIYSSPSVEKVLGYTTEDYFHKYPSDIIHPDDLPGYLEKRKELLGTPGNSFHFEHRRLHKNGDWIWCDGTVTNQLDVPEISALVSNFRDVSEKKIRESEHEFDRNNLDALINNTSDLMWSVDKDFNLITSNQPFDEMGMANFGNTIPKGGNVLAVSYSPEMKSHFKQLYERAFAGEAFTETDYFDYPVEFWTEISYNPIFKEDVVIGTACHSRDITERKKSEETFIRLASIVESSKEAIIGLSLEGLIVSWNQAAKTLYEYSVEEILGKPYTVLLNTDHADEFSKNVEKMKVGEQLGHFESVHLKKDGKSIDVVLSISPINNTAGKLTGISINAQNISEQKRAEVVLYEMANKGKVKAKKRVALELTIGLSLSLWLYFLSITFNLPQKLFDIIGNPTNSILDDLILVMAFLFIVAIVFGFRRVLEVRQGGEVVQNALKVLTKELEMRVLERTNDFSKSNEVLRGEIRERQKAEQNMEQQNKELKKTNTELDRFVYSTSHDLRAPLASLLGLIGMVNDDIDPVNTLQIEHMAMMKQSVLKLDNFIEDILNYSRNSRTEIAKDDIVFEDMIQEARAEHKFMEGTEGFKLKVEVEQTGKFSSDKRRINVILNNLISNAIKYKDAAKEKSFVHIAIHSDKKNATIIVEDNGIGIAEKDKGKIFEMFYRATKQSTGSGLGLYIVKETVDKLGAMIILESEKLAGSKFTVTIPNLLNNESKKNSPD